MTVTSICTTYKQVDGWHVFVSGDLPGLYVASRDLATAWHDVAPSIEALMLLDSDVQCVATPESTLDEFIARAHGLEPAGLPPEKRRFAVMRAQA